MLIPVYFLWLPGYIDVMQTILIILTCLEFFQTDLYVYVTHTQLILPICIIINNAAMNILIHVSLSTYASFSWEYTSKWNFWIVRYDYLKLH